MWRVGGEVFETSLESFKESFKASLTPVRQPSGQSERM